MATVIKAKRSAVQGKVPTTADLELGELAINTFDGKVFIKRNQNGTESVIDVTSGSATAYTTGSIVLTTTTANQVADTFPITSYRTVKYLIELSTSTNYHATEIVVTHDNTVVYATEYGSVYSSASLGTIDFDISSSNVRMLVSPSNTNTTVRFARFEVNATTATGGGASALSDLTDVDFTSAPTNGQVLTYDSVSSKWKPATASGGATVTVSNTAPSSPTYGDLWLDSSTDVFKLRLSSAWTNILTSPGIVYPATNGEQSYTSPGTYSWTCPAGVTYVHVVCVGGGGGGTGSSSGGCGGGGGGLAWRNDIPVTPGTSYTVVVGAGGAGGTTTGSTAGGNSYFANTSTVVAYGGGAGAYNGSATGGGYFPNGGNGGNSTQSSSTASSGGGGAGGYTGNGGSGTSTSGTAGAGGGGGAGGTGISGGYAGGGGGVGLLGQGTSGAAGTGAGQGSGGSGGVGGATTPSGGSHGGGGGGNDATLTGGPGAGGAVRIIWGPSRAFPSTNTGVL